MELGVALAVGEVALVRQSPVRTMTAHAAVCRTWDVCHVMMPFSHGLSQSGLDLGWREALVASAVDDDRRILSDSLDKILCICQEHLIVGRVRTVCRVGKPEVLPYHDSVSVACLIELHVSCLAHPVAHDVEIHVSMVCHCDVIFPCAVGEVVLRESPVSATTDESSSIYIYMEHFVDLLGVHLAYSHIEVSPVGFRFVDLERE